MRGDGGIFDETQEQVEEVFIGVVDQVNLFGEPPVDAFVELEEASVHGVTIAGNNDDDASFEFVQKVDEFADGLFGVTVVVAGFVWAGGEGVSFVDKQDAFEGLDECKPRFWRALAEVLADKVLFCDNFDDGGEEDAEGVKGVSDDE